MGNKRIQKRSKLINKNDTSHTPSNVHLSHNTNPSSKTLTAEEIELEEAVFGHALINKGKQKEDASEDKSGEVEAPIQVDLHLAEVADDEVCYTVSNVLKHRHLALTDLTFFCFLLGIFQLFMMDTGDGKTDTMSTQKPLSTSVSAKQPAPPKPKSTNRQPVWEDPSIAQVSISLTTGPNRLKKLRKVTDLEEASSSKADGTIDGEEYERRLREQFERMNPKPNWLAERQNLKRKQTDGESDDEESDPEGIDQILRKTGKISKNKPKYRSGVALPQGELEVERLRDANQANLTRSPISSIQFHPHSPILFTASPKSHTLSFFKIDGKHNPALHHVQTPDLPVTSAEFCPSTQASSTVLMTGNRPYFYSFDLVTCQCTKSPESLFSKSVVSQSTKGTSLSRFSFSPQGQIVAFLGLRGLISLVDWSNNIGSSQIIGSMKSNAPIKSLSWNRNGTELLTLGSDAEVSVWDMRMRKLLTSWKDHGGFNPSLITTTDKDSKRASGRAYSAIGSHSGIVNIYDDSRWCHDEDEDRGGLAVERQPMRTIENLTTSVTTMKFNPDGQMLAIASETRRDSLKLVSASVCCDLGKDNLLNCFCYVLGM